MALMTKYELLTTYAYIWIVLERQRSLGDVGALELKPLSASNGRISPRLLWETSSTSSTRSEKLPEKRNRKSMAGGSKKSPIREIVGAQSQGGFQRQQGTVEDWVELTRGKIKKGQTNPPKTLIAQNNLAFRERTLIAVEEALRAQTKRGSGTVTVVEYLHGGKVYSADVTVWVPPTDRRSTARPKTTLKEITTPGGLVVRRDPRGCGISAGSAQSSDTSMVLHGNIRRSGPRYAWGDNSSAGSAESRTTRGKCGGA